MAIADQKVGKRYFRMLEELNKYGFQCSASPLSLFLIVEFLGLLISFFRRQLFTR